MDKISDVSEEVGEKTAKTISESDILPKSNNVDPENKKIVETTVNVGKGVKKAVDEASNETSQSILSTAEEFVKKQ